MIEILRDPIWQFIGAVLALIAIGISIYLFLLQRNRKKLSYQVLAETELLTVNEEIKGKLKIIYEGVPVQNAHLLVLKIINNGNLPIATADFEDALMLIFGEKANVLSAEIIKTSPKTLKPHLNIQSNKIIIQPTLFNSQDNFTIKLLIAQYDGQIETYSRIIGVGEVKRVKDRSRQITTFLAVAGGVSLNAVAIILVDWFRGNPTNSTETLRVVLATTMLTLSVALVVLIIYFLKRNDKFEKEK